MTTTRTNHETHATSGRAADTNASMSGASSTSPANPLPCPISGRCETCKRTTALVVVEADTDLGVVCITVCQHCRDQERPLPRLSVTEAAIRVLDHREHTSGLLDRQPATHAWP